jgi:hypothetical protein
MTNYIVFDYGATLDIIADNSLQSVEFENGKLLADTLRDRVCGSSFSRTVHCCSLGEGLFFLRQGSSARYLVIDLDQINPFSWADLTDTLVVAQKLLRLAIKIWDNSKLSSSEWLIPNSKFVLFPFPFSSNSRYRITLQRNPDAKRSERRGAGDHLLVFREGRDEGDRASAVPSVQNFRLALKYVQEARSTIVPPRISGPLEPTPMPISVTTLGAEERPTINAHLGFEKWRQYLTATQRQFIERIPLNAERIEGPAGTGKTLCLVLKCLNTLIRADQEGKTHYAVFFAHSQATERAIRSVFEANQPKLYSNFMRTDYHCSVLITTLQSWCGQVLGERNVSEAQFLDKDAMEAKQLSIWYVEESLDEAMNQEFSTYKPFLSHSFAEFIERENRGTLTEMVQHEIAVMIKGRAGENLDNYKALPLIKYNLPIGNDSDRGFIFSIFRRYSEKLLHVAQYDTDDIVLSSIGQLNTPIWRRKRRKEGFDSIFVDETHLFNINELSVFHYLTRNENEFPIVFSVDRSQALGDRGISTAMLGESILPSALEAKEPISTRVKSVFRCSPDITALALSVTAAGATLFTNFDNPLESATSAFTLADEQKASQPTLLMYPTDHEMIIKAFARADKMATEINCPKSDILLVAFSSELFNKMERMAMEMNKPIEVLKERGDIEVQNRARKAGRFVLAAPDYIAGLEFQGVILVGVDDGRVPPSGELSLAEGIHFEEYRAHNRLYVATTRAKYRLEILASKARGPSRILSNALSSKLLNQSEE